ncbi:MAG: zinc ribbon domain-containing protein [Deltaproteobacteria bacterium]|nr:zinc ribbon domain-containing protein [Deltaproteobacteria bacterium]
MPIYEFECRECRQRFDELVRNAADLVEAKCPACGSGEVRREVSAPAAGSARAGGGSGDHVPPRRGSCSPFS